MILIIDNFDSFTYNLIQYVGSINPDIRVVKNNEFSIEELSSWDISHIIISPGPGRPENAGISIDVIKYFGKKEVPILGVCLGHQAIGLAFGGKIVNAADVVHGKTSKINILKKSLILIDVPNQFEATRYHSLLIDFNTLPNLLVINSVSDNNEIMGIEHSEYKIYGVQFHPESIKTDFGYKIIDNFLKIA